LSPSKEVNANQREILIVQEENNSSVDDKQADKQALGAIIAQGISFNQNQSILSPVSKSPENQI
jgi:hypothetical protein